MALLTLTDVSYQYPETQQLAISHVDLAVAEHALTVIVGPSGVGKSTILNLVAGYTTPASGQVTMAGQLVTQPSWQRGIVFQDMALYPWLTVAQNVTFGPRMRGLKSEAYQALLTELLTDTGLLTFRDRPVYALSGGLKQRVALARACINQPPLLMLDESFSALDNATRNQMHQLLLKLWRKLGNSVIAITHDIDEALFLGQRIVVINGKPGTVAATLDNPYFTQDMTGTTDSAYPAFRQRLLGLIAQRD
ncbi:ABC transporter ATP-binding protein [Levilactobacillus namurensis]|uniref:ABC transporter ATP-binding protein n=1 Tax=Levilactobacillus namurensis TaxID=380393 RepID=UPI0026EF78B6|nr:ABC transporter ATP-binding protein [Levilactobacillus namurensis]